MRYDHAIIDRILSSVSITDEFEELGTNIVKRSRNGEHTAYCIFHKNENSPALSINENKGVYHCFSCKEQGNIFKLLEQKKGLVFRDAVKYLADKASIDVSGYEEPDNFEVLHRIDVLHRLSELNNLAAEWFQNKLEKADKALKYLKTRGIRTESAGAFSLGYGGEGRDGLFHHLTQKGYTKDEIVQAGLAGENQDGSVFDLFRFRLIFPIKDKRGRIAGFSGRILEDNPKWAKYLNTKETPLFKKGSLLFGLYENAQAIRDFKFVTLVEGYMDVIGLWQGGIHTALAPMGTAFTPTQGDMIRKTGAEEAYLMFDADKAGEGGAAKAVIELAGKMKTSVVILPDHKDPDEIVLSQGPSGIDRLLQKAVTPLEFLYTNCDKSFEYISREPSYIKQEKLIKQLAGLIEVPVDAVRKDYQKKYFKGIKSKEEDSNLVDGEEYQGRKEWVNFDKSEVVITKDWMMYHHKKWEKKNKKGESVPDEDFERIITSYVFLPKYKVRIDDQVLYNIECRRPKIKPFVITIPESSFGEAAKLQNAFTRYSISINIGRMRQVIHSYVSDNSQEITPAYVGVNYLEDGKSFLCGYDYIVKEGNLYPADGNIVKVSENEIYYIAGHELKEVNRSKNVRQYTKTETDPEGKIREFIKKSEKLFKTKQKPRITLAFLATAMLREKLLDRFNEVPSLNYYGKTASCGKTTFLDAVSAITNIEKHKASISEYQIYRLQEQRKNGLILLDDLRPIEKYIGIIKDVSSRTHRTRQLRDGRETNPPLQNSIFMTTNHMLNLESEEDSEAIESRVINIHFTKDDLISDYEAYESFEMFYKDNAFAIYQEMYKHISEIDMDELAQNVDKIRKKIAKLELKTDRITKLWAILIACGEAVGIKMPLEDYLCFIKELENEKINKGDIMAAALLECALQIENEAKTPAEFKDQAKKDTITREKTVTDGYGGTLFKPVVLDKKYLIKLSDLSNFFRQTQFMNDWSQQNIMKEVYSLDFIKKHRDIGETRYIKGEKVWRNSTHLEINFAHEIFSNTLAVVDGFMCVKAPENLGNKKASPEEIEKMKEAANASEF